MQTLGSGDRIALRGERLPVFDATISQTQGRGTLDFHLHLKDEAIAMMLT